MIWYGRFMTRPSLIGNRPGSTRPFPAPTDSPYFRQNFAPFKQLKFKLSSPPDSGGEARSAGSILQYFVRVFRFVRGQRLCSSWFSHRAPRVFVEMEGLAAPTDSPPCFCQNFAPFKQLKFKYSAPPDSGGEVRREGGRVPPLSLSFFSCLSFRSWSMPLPFPSCPSCLCVKCFSLLT